MYEGESIEMSPKEGTNDPNDCTMSTEDDVTMDWKCNEEEAISEVSKHGFEQYFINMIKYLYDTKKSVEEIVKESKLFILGEFYTKKEDGFLLNLLHEPERLDEVLEIHAVTLTKDKNFKLSDLRIFGLMAHIYLGLELMKQHPPGLYHLARWYCFKRLLNQKEFIQGLLEDIYNDSFPLEDFKKKYKSLVTSEDWKSANLNELLFLVRSEKQCIKLFLGLHYTGTRRSIEELGCQKIFVICHMHLIVHHINTHRPNISPCDLETKFVNAFHDCSAQVSDFDDYVKKKLKKFVKNHKYFEKIPTKLKLGDEELEKKFEDYYLVKISMELTERNAPLDIEEFFVVDINGDIDMWMRFNKKLVLKYRIEEFSLLGIIDTKEYE